ncbi:MAG: glutamine amidotransferase [Anaerolineae bacterium]
MARIYYVGDWAVSLGPVFAETPFNYADKGLDIFYYGRWLKDALESSGEHQVEDVAAWDFYKLGPGEYERILDAFDVIIFSDVEAKNFQLAPSFFDRNKFGTQVLTYPDRVRLTVEAVQTGKPMMFLGGWLSFTGEMGKGGWNRTRLREILPVRCLDYEDLVESTEGYTAQVTAAGEKAFEGVDFTSFPPILGYNRTLPRVGCQVLLAVGETGDPLVAAGAFDRGRVLAYLSDPAPHWGCNFVYWEGYPAFWLACLRHLLDG